ncbi:MAG: fumarylacetoacetate hydrolase family protein [Candidatus Margulisbacteria bacterium]|nr:fumarylacetoacetate hydrolase family protein [Candidatus Margulisiibacteriota bacterium]
MKKLKPTKIICVGLNYTDHAKELNMPIPDEPVLFMKPPSTLIYNNEPIVYPAMTKELHYEAELAIMIKDKIKNVSKEEVMKHILGFTCANDVTARDLQRNDGQWTRAKSFDSFCPVGPEVVKDIDPNNLKIKLYLNGEEKQSSNTSNMIFKVDYLVSFISQVMTLEADDIIITGTPPGVGEMKVGDVVEVEIEGIGKLTNRIIKPK